jgi:hypothetical protein
MRSVFGLDNAGHRAVIAENSSGKWDCSVFAEDEQLGGVPEQATRFELGRLEKIQTDFEGNGFSFNAGTGFPDNKGEIRISGRDDKTLIIKVNSFGMAYEI